MMGQRLLVFPGFMMVLWVFGCSTAPSLVVTGEDLAWKVENDFFIVDFSANAETGRNGQLKTIQLKGLDVLLTRGTDRHTLHLSPNLAQGGGWVGINRWETAEKWDLEQESGVFRLTRSGPMPMVPGIHARCVYEIRSDSPAILVEESMEAVEDAEVSLLRLDEWSFVPEGNPFTHIGWAGPDLQPHLEERKGNPQLPLQTPWVAFYDHVKGFGVASVKLGMEVNEAVLQDESVRFSGEPHYFYRALIYPPGKIGEGDPDPLVRLEKGTKYLIRYNLLLFRGEGTSADTALKSVVEFQKRGR